jgi:hypothetical protein
MQWFELAGEGTSCEKKRDRYTSYVTFHDTSPRLVCYTACCSMVLRSSWIRALTLPVVLSYRSMPIYCIIHVFQSLIHSCTHKLGNIMCNISREMVHIIEGDSKKYESSNIPSCSSFVTSVLTAPNTIKIVILLVNYHLTDK